MARLCLNNEIGLATSVKSSSDRFLQRSFGVVTPIRHTGGTPGGVKPLLPMWNSIAVTNQIPESISRCPGRPP